ncbi:hypothetical protein ABDK00_014995 [Niabella insulamsoli]|uniref:hypothetical protein n=1 Tax=Niabella insulamsoli TaxID=3144874 RepID=UPI0031FE35C6
MPQIITDANNTYLTMSKRVEKNQLLLEDRKIAMKAIVSVQTIVGSYQPFSQANLSANAELEVIKQRLSALEKHLR